MCSFCVDSSFKDNFFETHSHKQNFKEKTWDKRANLQKVYRRRYQPPTFYPFSANNREIETQLLLLYRSDTSWALTCQHLEFSLNIT